MQRTNFLIRSLLLLTIYSSPLHGMENTKASQSSFDILPAELRRKILFEQDPVILQNAINYMAQQPITITENCEVCSVIIVGDTLITRTLDTSLNDGTPLHKGCVKIWDVHTGKYIHTLLTYNGYKNRPHSLTIHNNKIAAGFDNCTIKIWDMLNAYEQIKTLVAERPWARVFSCVTRLAMDDNNKIIASVTGTVKIFDIDSEKCLQTFYVADCSINGLATDNSYIYTGAADGLVKIFDYNGNCIHTFNDFKGRLFCVCTIAKQKDIIIATSSKELKVWDLKTKLCISRFLGWHNHAYFKSAQIDQDKIIVGDHNDSSSNNNCAKIVSVTDGTVMRTLTGLKKHTKGILSVDIKGNIAVTGSKDCTAKIWPLVTNLTGTAETNPSLWIIEKSDPLQANFIRRAYELTDQEKECIIAWPNHFNEIEKDESPAQRDGRIYFSIPVFVRDYLRDHLIVRK